MISPTGCVVAMIALLALPAFQLLVKTCLPNRQAPTTAGSYQQQRQKK
jgi:hypothetical protein